MADTFNIEVEELAQLLCKRETLVLLDVREAWEVGICALAESLFIPMSQIQVRAREIPTNRRVVVVCHHGIRSYHVVGWLRRLGYRHVLNLRGGIDAWARRIDQGMAIY